MGQIQSSNIVWSVDMSFPVHKDMKSYTVMSLILRQGADVSGTVKHKINTGNSTESELIGFDNAFP